jgi:hypothetical protein
LPAVGAPQDVGEARIAEQHAGREEQHEGRAVHSPDQELRHHDDQRRQRILDQRAVQAGVP